MAGIREVAAAAGVSTSTVSRVLSGNIPVAESTRDKVLEAVRLLDYYPNPMAQGLKGQSLKTIALIVPNVRDLVFPAAIKGIEDCARQSGYTLVLCNTDEDFEREVFYIQNLRRRLIDGFIVSTARDDHRHLAELVGDKFPVVFLIRQPRGLRDANSVVLDNGDGGYQATKHLIGKGYRRIAIVSGDLDIELYRERFEGYKRALAEAGLSLDDGLVVKSVSGWKESYQAMREMLARGIVPEAVFATSDPKAIGIYRAIKDCGLCIPADIAVVGFDNSDISSLMDPPMTTVAQPFYDMGARACERLIRLIEGKRRTGPKTEVFPAHLVVRHSVRQGPAADGR